MHIIKISELVKMIILNLAFLLLSVLPASIISQICDTEKNVKKKKTKTKRLIIVI